MPDANYAYGPHTAKTSRPSITQQEVDDINKAYARSLNRDIAVLARLLLEKLEARAAHIEAVGFGILSEGSDREILRDLRGTLNTLAP